MNNYEDLYPTENLVEKEQEDLICKELSKIDGLHEYFRALMNRDMKLHFTCTKDQQDLARGAFYRMEYLSKKIKAQSLDKK